MYSTKFEQRSYHKLFSHRGSKFVIGTLHGTPVEITAQYNPKELARQASATWNSHPNTSAGQGPRTGDSHGVIMEYGNTAPRMMTVELLFDGYEEGICISPFVEKLENLTLPVDRQSKLGSERHPQLCVAVWGAQQLRCVVTSVATKLTMFDEAGQPLRAICTVQLTEIDVSAALKNDRSYSKFESRQDQLRKNSAREMTPMTREHWNKPAEVVRAGSQTKTDTRGYEEDRPERAPIMTSATVYNKKTVGTPSQRFAGDSDLDSPRQPRTATPGVGTPSQRFAGDDDLDSPRQGPTAKTRAAYDDAE